MSLSLKFSLSESEDREQIIIKDKTGSYDANSNPGGYGSPNPAVGSAYLATLSAYKRNDDGTWEAAPVPTVSVYPTLPNLTLTPAYVTATAFGYGSTFQDGIYKFVYRVSSPVSFDVSTESIFVLKGNIDCCVKKKAATFAKCKCNCDGFKKEFTNVSLYNRLLNAAICCVNLNDIQNSLDILTKACSDCGCGCGGKNI